ncbi:NlpC/P60 family protein [Nocardia nova SH22a]|uniref:NlpC/P60 family protein n=1 Tax=Nocardia nova SH22a TaxID=1415166 RepID=W5TB36_9NOCA|nr:DUF4226 domain-containing protein [Nocardia nova]AHH16397.1 NlpC/P60 family protein [Nocardia nova SH22a]
MTTADVWHTGIDPEPEPADGAEQNPETPGAKVGRPNQDRRAPSASPGVPSNPGGTPDNSSRQQAAPTAPPQSPPAAAPGQPAASGVVPSGVGAQGVGVGPPVQAAPPGTGAAGVPPQANQGQVAPAQSDTGQKDPGGLLDPDTMMALAPAAMMGMSMLPMLAMALSGLGGGNGSGTAQPVAGEAGGTALTPEARQARNALQKLKDTYGDEDKDPSDPESASGRKRLDTGGTGSSAGKGATATRIKLSKLYERNVANAFNTLDNDLVDYMRKLAGKHKVDKKAVTELLRDVDAQLAEIGSAAYTKTGVQQVHKILTNALKKATQIVSGGNVNSKEAAAEINRLTKQYIYNLAGKEYKQASAVGGAGGGSAAGQRAVQVALQQQGDPYVWGAEGPNSFDCSGLTQYSARAAGVSIPRVAAQQYQQLPKVAPSDIQPGDLIFPAAQFNNGNPSHVMMYIGNGQCIEAPKPGSSVRVTNLPNGYYASRWAK